LRTGRNGSDQEGEEDGEQWRDPERVAESHQVYRGMQIATNQRWRRVFPELAGFSEFSSVPTSRPATEHSHRGRMEASALPPTLHVTRTRTASSPARHLRRIHTQQPETRPPRWSRNRGCSLCSGIRELAWCCSLGIWGKRNIGSRPSVFPMYSRTYILHLETQYYAIDDE